MTTEPVKITRNTSEFWGTCCIEADPEEAGWFRVTNGQEYLSGLTPGEALRLFIAYCDSAALSLEREADRSATVAEWRCIQDEAIAWRGAIWLARRDLNAVYSGQAWVA